MIHACCHRYNKLQCDLRRQPSVADSSGPFFDASFSISVKSIPLSCTGVFRVARVCVRCRAACRAWSAPIFFVDSPRFLTREAFFAVSATTETCINILTNMIQCLAEPSRKPMQAIESIIITVPYFFHVHFVPKKAGAVLEYFSAVRFYKCTAVLCRLFITSHYCSICV